MRTLYDNNRTLCPVGISWSLVLFAAGCARLGYDLVTLQERDGGTSTGTPQSSGPTGSDLLDGGGRPSATNVGSTAPDASLTRPDDQFPSAPDATTTRNDAEGGTCGDGIVNQDESGLDCGGVCVPCLCNYGDPELLGNPNFPGNNVYSPSLQADGESIFIGALVPGFSEFIASATRTATSSEFSLGEPLPAPVAQTVEGTPHITPNGLGLYFYSTRNGADRDLFRASRPSTSDSFNTVVELSSLNGNAAEHLPWVSAEDLDIYFLSNREVDWNIYHAARLSPLEPFGAPQLVPELNDAGSENGVTLSADQRVVLFTSPRSGLGGQDIFRAVRATKAEPFSIPKELTVVNSSADDVDVSLTPSGRFLYFSSNRNGSSYEIWRSLRTCP